MPELCQNCGAELYEGQQFCRRCGTPVGVGSRLAGEAPTQLFPQGPEAGTARAGGETGRVVAGQRPTEYQPVGGQQTSALVGQPFGSQPLAVVAPTPPAPKRRRGLWLFALLAVFVLGAGVATGAAFIWWRATRPGTVVKVIKTAPPFAPEAPAPPEMPDIPDVPGDLGERIKAALKEHGVPMPLGESGAVNSGDDTTLTRTFALDSDASFSAHVPSGNVTVVGSDDADETVVKIVKRGGSAQERAAARVLAAESEEGVTLLGTPARNGRVSVSYEITVPRRGLRRLEISVQKGEVSVKGFDGELDLNVTNGNVSVDAAGAARGRVVNGKMRVVYSGQHDEAQEFSVTNGDVDLLVVGGGPSVDLKAAATNGKIEVHDAFGVKAEKRGSGYRLERQFGAGGAPLTVKVVNGDIRVKP